MRTIFRWVALVWLGGLANGQNEVRPPAFVRFVSGIVPGDGKVSVEIDGRSLYAKGYELGDVSGAVSFPPGSRDVEVRREGVGSGRTTVELVEGETTTLVAFAEQVRSGEEKVNWRVKILRLKEQSPEKGYRVTVLSVCAAPVAQFRIADASHPEGRVEKVPQFSIGVFNVGGKNAKVRILSRDGEELLADLYFEEPGNHVVILHDAEGNKTKAVTFYDQKFLIAR